MPIVVVSLHERDAPLDVLDRLAIGEEELPKALAQLGDSTNLAECVVLSTCMRTEVYALAERFHEGLTDIQSFFQARLGDSKSSKAVLDESLIVEFDDAAARHLFEVASGIDSPVLGEGEVLRQVRSAHERARAERAAGPVLDVLFRKAIEVGKRARTETAISRGTTSLAHVAVTVAAERLDGGLAGRRVVVIGAGEMGDSLVGALAPVASGTEVVVANRSRPRATAAARRLGGRGIALDQLPGELAAADVIFSATASPEVVLGVEALRVARRGVVRRPLVIIDAAVPRDVDPEVASLPGVSLLDVDDLCSFAEREMASRRGEVDRVRAIIDEEIERYVFDARGRSVAPLVTSLRARAEELRVAELSRVESAFTELSADERAALEVASKRIVAKLLHGPTVELKRAAGTPRGERLAEALRTLFDL